MGRTAKLKVSLEAEHAEFRASMKAAAKSVDELNGHVKKHGEHMKEFDAHMLASRHAIASFAAIGNTGASPILHLVHAFEALPGALGIALGVMLMIREAMNSDAEAAKHAAEQEEYLADTMKRMDEIAGGGFEGRAKAADSEVDALDKKLKQMKSELGEESGIDKWARKNGLDWIGGENPHAKDRNLMDTLEQQRTKALELRDSYKFIDDELERINDKKFEVKLHHGSAQDELKVLKQEVATIQEMMSNTKLKGPMNELKHRMQEAQLEIQKIEHPEMKMGDQHGSHLATGAFGSAALVEKLKHTDQAYQSQQLHLLNQIVANTNKTARFTGATASGALG
jgi:hypothetical protein